MLRCSALLLLAVSAFAQKPTFTVGWSVYAGWTPYHYLNQSGILRKWADKYGITIKVQRNYKPSTVRRSSWAHRTGIPLCNDLRPPRAACPSAT